MGRGYHGSPGPGFGFRLFWTSRLFKPNYLTSSPLPPLHFLSLWEVSLALGPLVPHLPLSALVSSTTPLAPLADILLAASLCSGSSLTPR
jgi:hypothetical protein